jgi:hypothetical protein
VGPVLPVGPVTLVSLRAPLLDVTNKEFVVESKDNAPVFVFPFVLFDVSMK